MSCISTIKSKIGSVVQDDRIKKELLRRSIVTAKCRHRASHLLLCIAVHYYDEGLELPPLKEGAKHTRFMAHIFTLIRKETMMEHGSWAEASSP